VARYLITSALPYINGIKHLGNLVGSLLPADVAARTLRMEGEEVLFICATDEHGTPAELAAREAGQEVAEFARREHVRQREVYEAFALSFDWFGRTSSAANHEMTERFYQKLDENGFIEERTIRQFFSVDDDRFLPDRYVTGTCPHCGYERARGDQCENCTRVLDPVDLIGPRSTISGSERLELRETRHLFLNLGPLAERLRQFILAHEDWPRLSTSVALKWLDEGLRPRAITRDLSWGVPVPREGFRDKVFYVWFDAPIGYIGATKEWADAEPFRRDWRRWWLQQDDVRYIQFMAKDNLPFHTIFFPGMEMGSGEPWTLASYIKGFSWLTYDGGKFSTSQGRGVFMDQALDILPADYWRYGLLAQAPETDDADFTWERFAATVNKDLVGMFGNYCHRVLTLTVANFGAEVPVGGVPGAPEARLTDDVKSSLDAYRAHLRAFEYRRAVQELRRLWSLGNLYLEERAPWRLVKQDRETAAAVLRQALNLMRVYALAAWPLMPAAARTVLNGLGCQDDLREPRYTGAERFHALIGGESLMPFPPLFRRLDADEVAALSARYAGTGPS
jgi:methionyl-tRNA synthetase